MPNDLTRETLDTLRRVADARAVALKEYIADPSDRARALRLEQVNVARGNAADAYFEELLSMASRCVSEEAVQKLAEAFEARSMWREAMERGTPAAMCEEARWEQKAHADFAELVERDLRSAAEALRKKGPA